MPRTIVFSFFLHGALVIIGIVGLPYIKKPILPPEPISVEIVEIDEITQTNRKPSTPKKEKPIEKKIEPPKEDKPVAPPKVDLKEPPKVVNQQPKVEEKPKPKPKSKPKPPPPEELKQPEPEPKKEEKLEESTPEQQEQFLSLLKNLQDGAPDAAQAEAVETDQSDQKQPSPLAQFSNRVTQTEMDAMRAALNRQFASCWNLSAGAKFAEDIVVKIRLIINRDRSVNSVSIVDQWRYTQDSFFRAAADNVVRAVRHPQCRVLDLPPQRYEFWKDSIFNFNPSSML